MEYGKVSQEIEGPIYILKLKVSDKFKSKEMLYAIVHKGDENFGLARFRRFCWFYIADFTVILVVCCARSG